MKGIKLYTHADRERVIGELIPLLQMKPASLDALLDIVVQRALMLILFPHPRRRRDSPSQFGRQLSAEGGLVRE